MADDRPVSSAQRRLWVLDRLAPRSAAYVVPLVHRIDGELDVLALEGALTEVVRRHEVLRTVFRPRSRDVRQVVRPSRPVRIPVLDLSGHPDPRAEADRLAAEEARRPFDLGADLMIRPLLLRTAADRHRLCLTLHHIVCDGWSLHVLHDELAFCYGSLRAGTAPRLPPLPLQYADFAEEQAGRLAEPSLRRELDHWREQLAGLPAVSTVAADHPRPAQRSLVGGRVGFAVDASVCGRVDSLARACRTTPFCVFLAVFAAQVRAWTGGDEAVIGTPVTTRERECHHRLIGMFVNTVVLRLTASAETTFLELVHRAHTVGRQAIAHRGLPFERLVEELNPPREPGVNPLFQLLLGYQDGRPPRLDLPGCEITTEFGDTSTTKVDLALKLTRTPGGCTGRLDYDRDLFEASTAARLAARFRSLLAEATAAPRLSVADLGAGTDE